MVKNLPSYILVFKCSFWKINYVNNFWKNVKFKLFIYSVYTPLHDVNQSKVINLTMNPEVLWKVNYGNFSSHPSARPSYHLSSFVVGCNLFLNFDFDFQRSSGWEWFNQKNVFVFYVIRLFCIFCYPYEHKKYIVLLTIIVNIDEKNKFHDVIATLHFVTGIASLYITSS